MNRKKWLALSGLLVVFGLLVLAGCSKKENTEQASNATEEKMAAPAPAATPIDPPSIPPP
jgi:hypothetical protein